MRKLHANCPKCATMRSWYIDNILTQMNEICLAQCSCVMCGNRELISFKIELQNYEQITIKGYETLDVSQKQHEPPKLN